MKTLFRVLCLLVVPSVFAQDVIYKDQVTVQWDAVEETGGAIAYEVFVADSPVVSPQDAAAHQSLGETSALELAVSVSWDTHKALGVRAIMTLPDASRRYSPINWSDANGVSTPNPFLLVSVQNPAMPIGLGVKD